MYKPFLLSLAALSGVGVSNAPAGPADKTTSYDISTWRWQVSTILDAQHASRKVGATPTDTVTQRHQRFPDLERTEAFREDPRR
ncbi:MAG: hypothetical protein JO107_15485 [Hyphomicrobiales bacterium]|nr:hypothetical protein [Hyphomicrobiales bacterium]MBV8664493.1 hypothetical protein [Hyphomicrobiales bacterium]